MFNDLRFAVRQLLKHPGFTCVAIVILGLGIGANSAMFSIINALLFKPLAVEQPEALVRVHSRHLNPDGGFRSFSYPNFLDIRTGNDVFHDVTAFGTAMIGLTEGEETRRTFALSVAANYFRTFGVRLARGREFLPEEERPDAGIPVAIISHSYWKRRGSDPAVLGQTLRINGRSFQIVGVAPQGFSGLSALLTTDVYVPLGVQQWLANDFMGQKGRTLSDRSNHALMIVGRLKTGLLKEQAQARLEPLGSQLREAYPDANADQMLVLSRPSRLSINTAPSNDGEVMSLTALLLPMSGVVLLIAALNLANMLLARGTARQKEFAIRAALGGGRFQIVRQLVCEAFLLSLAGGMCALLLASWVSQLLAGAMSSKMPFAIVMVDSRPDVRVLAGTFVCCLFATFIATIMPALRLSKVDVMRDLKEQSGEGRHERSGRSIWAPRNLLVTAQVALSLVLLTVAALFFRGAMNAAKTNPGFRFEQGILAELDAGLGGYDTAKAGQLYRSVLDKVRQLPGVESASLATSVPFGLFSDGRTIGRPGSKQAQADGTKLSGAEEPFYANYTIISEDYFRSLGSSMVRGREFSTLEAEGQTASRVCIINEAAAKKLWPGEDPLGRQLEVLDDSSGAVVLEVVGIAPPYKAAIGDAEANPSLYLPLGQAFQSMVNLHVRLNAREEAAAKSMLPTLRATLKEADAQLPVLSMNTLHDFHNDGFVMWMFRTGARLLLSFALLALVLAAVGLYGVKSFVVARRTREIGIRMALGATHKQVVWMVLRSGLSLTGIGLVIGAVLALGAGLLLRGILFGVSAADPISFGISILVLSIVAAIASYFPARRAASVDPIHALRTE